MLKIVGKKKLIIILLVELIISGLVLLADLLTKKYVYGFAKENGYTVLIDGFISLIAVQNTGASFGIFKQHTFILSIISIIASVIVAALMVFTVKNRNFFLRFALITIFAGATGNLADRLAFGYVRDFLNFEFMEFAVFNVADAALTAGTIAMVIFIIFFYKPKPSKRELAKSDGKK